MAKKKRKPPADGCFWTPEELVAFNDAYLGRGGRNIELLAMTLEGWTRTHMASRLEVTIDTVNKLCDRLHKRLDAKDSLAIMRKFIIFRDEYRRRQEFYKRTLRFWVQTGALGLR